MGDNAELSSRSMADVMSASAGDSGGDEAGDRKGQKGRELSQSKRAAQNRAAQRAFRQRKEGYIKKLEEEVREHHVLENNYKAIQSENHTLREYIISLQSKLLEVQGVCPPPPPQIDLTRPPSLPRVLHTPLRDGSSPRTRLEKSPVSSRTAPPLGTVPPSQKRSSQSPELDPTGLPENLEARALNALQAAARERDSRLPD